MRTWRAHELGKAEDVLRLEGVPEPHPGPGDVVVEVEAVGLNFAENLMLAGTYQEKMPLPFTPGLEACGRVVAAGEGVSTPVGSRVIAVLIDSGGGLAERVVVSEANIRPAPDSIDPVDGAALYITYMTGHLALHRRAHLQPGEVLLVHAGAGGSGSAAIQLGKAAGARVIATAGGAEKVAVCRELGAEIAIDYRSEDFVSVVKEATGGRGADVIFDPVGGDVFDRSRRCIAWEGRLLVIGFTSGRIPEAPANHLLVKNYAVLGLYAGNYRKVDPGVERATHAALMELHATGAIRPLVRERVSFADAPAALSRLGARDSVGKLVVMVKE